jgi:hypothetical protein
MESLPFADASFAAAVSQFGYEYSETERTAKEMVRVLAPKARFLLVVHHASSSIVAVDRKRSDALDAFEEAQAAFCAGDSTAFAAQIAKLTGLYPQDRLIAELAHGMPSRIGRPPIERIAIWNAVRDALGPERCLSDALLRCCVAPERLDEWLAPLREASETLAVAVLRAANGDPIAWKIGGTCRE